MSSETDRILLTMIGGGIALALKTLIEAVGKRLNAGHLKQIAENERIEQQEQINMAAQKALADIGLDDIKEFRELRAAYKAQQEEILKLKAHNKEQDAAFRQLFDQNAQLKSQIADLNTENTSLQQKVADLTTRVNELIEEKANLTKQLEEARLKLGEI